jgi:hypothetical protein
MPALLTSPSMRPKAFTVASTIACGCGGVGEIARRALRRRAEMAAGGVDLGLIAAMDQHFRALADEALSHRVADAGRGAGDEDGLACKSAHEMVSVSVVVVS